MSNDRSGEKLTRGIFNKGQKQLVSLFEVYLANCSKNENKKYNLNTLMSEQENLPGSKILCMMSLSSNNHYPYYQAEPLKVICCQSLCWVRSYSLSEGAEGMGMGKAACPLNWAWWQVLWGDRAGSGQVEDQVNALACPQLHASAGTGCNAGDDLG